ncbi:hypothetical protein PM082_021109 [Marasmius tenuissimus]|nr:hypothetical protein PM082_021109 [Marasmius tenuissimus]
MHANTESYSISIRLTRDCTLKSVEKQKLNHDDEEPGPSSRADINLFSVDSMDAAAGGWEPFLE